MSRIRVLSFLVSFSCFFFKKKMYKILQIITTILFPDSFSFQLNSWTTSANLYKLKEKKHFPGLEHPSHCYTHAHTPGGMWVTTLWTWTSVLRLLHLYLLQQSIGVEGPKFPCAESMLILSNTSVCHPFLSHKDLVVFLKREWKKLEVDIRTRPCDVLILDIVWWACIQ